MLVEVPRWTEPEINAIDAAERVATWREADRRIVGAPTHVSLDVEASDDAEEARGLVRGALQGLVNLHPDAFMTSVLR